MLENLIKNYIQSCQKTDWLDNELYKFEWAKWVNDNINFDTTNDDLLYKLALDSQKQIYTNSTGVQFIKQGARKQMSKFIGTDDIAYFREFKEGKTLTDIGFELRNMSFPIISCWLAAFCPEKIFPVSRTSFADVIRKVFSAKVYNSGIAYVESLQPYCFQIDIKLKESRVYQDILKNKLQLNNLSQLEYNWAVQDFLLYLDRNPELFNQENTTQIQIDTIMSNFNLNQILYGPPGTGKTYNSINAAISIINPNFDLAQTRDVVKAEYERLVESGQVVFTTFHQSMSYEDFIEGIKPETKNEKVTYEIKDGVFKRLCKDASAKKTSKNFDTSYSKFVEEVLIKGSITLETPTHKKKFKVIINSNETAVAIPETEKGTNMGVTKEMSRDYVVNGAIRDWKPYTTSIGEYIKNQYPVDIDDVSNSNKKYVLIIDEINRGNVSAIFGELITLLEEDKRLESKESLELILPYSKMQFGVPKNLYIIGTMNTADRSVEAIDTALRRRFSFTEMMPKPELLLDIQFDGFNLGEVLQTINDRIEILLDRDHAIGHSYFLKVKSGDVERLKSVFKNSIFPLLQEYFYHDYEKIALILGSGFVEIKENHKVNFPKFNNLDAPEIGTQFKLIDNVVDIENAVQLLLNRNV